MPRGASRTGRDARGGLLAFLNIRVRDIAAVHPDRSARGAQFLTPPKQHQYEIRCYIRDPDGYSGRSFSPHLRAVSLAVRAVAKAADASTATPGLFRS
jgi:hypothetical protein